MSADGKISIGGLTIGRKSNLFPSRELESSVFSLIGQAGLDLCFCNADSAKNKPCSIYNADLWFGTNTTETTITYWNDSPFIKIEAEKLEPNKESFAWGNHGGISSLSDLSECVISFNFSDRISNDLNKYSFELAKKYDIKYFKINISDRIFSSGQLCINVFENYKQYYIKLPISVSGTHLNIKCNK